MTTDGRVIGIQYEAIFKSIIINNEHFQSKGFSKSKEEFAKFYLVNNHQISNELSGHMMLEREKK
jgi:hypothetical protein